MHLTRIISGSHRHCCVFRGDGTYSSAEITQGTAMATHIGENRAKRMLKNNELVLCLGVNQLRTPNIAMIAAACGFDAVYIDLEHNPTSLETAAGVCVAALGMGLTPIARVTSHDPHDATRILDCGAQGVMVPHVQNAAEAKAIVEACLYAPKGHRSAFGSGPQLGYAAIPRPKSAEGSTKRPC